MDDLPLERPDGPLPAREAALRLLHEWTVSDGLRRHALAVEAVMRAAARRVGGEEERWGLTGLLHDFDYERHNTPETHPADGAPVLRAAGFPEDVVRAILGHATWLGVPRDTWMARYLFACDELTGFVGAVARVMPGMSIHEVTVDSVLKKLRTKGFARTVSREEVEQGAAELGVALPDHIRFVLDALRPVAAEVGLAAAP